MFKTHIKIAWRNLTKHKTFTFISIISLSIGLSASFVIGMMVFYDISFDTFHKDGDRIFRIVTEFEDAQGFEYNNGIATPMRVEAQEGITGVENSGYFYNWWTSQSKADASKIVFKNPENIIFTDQGYFYVFDYQWVAGDKENILSQPNEVVLSQKRAAAYFPSLAPKDIIGKKIVYNETIIAQVTGIVADFENRTDLIFTEFVSLETAKLTDDGKNIFENDWGMTNSASNLFIKLQENVDAAAIQSQLNQIALNHADKNYEKYEITRRFKLQPLSDIHLNENYGIYDYTVIQSSKEVLIALGFVAIFLLLLGSINFINLNTAQAAQRAREIGVRKTLGSSRKQLIAQFLTETFLITGIAALLSISLSMWMLQVFRGFIPGGLNASILLQPQLIVFILLVFTSVALLSGIYPSLILSHFKPVRVLKGDTVISNKSSHTRKVLTVFQFSIAQVFIIATLLVGKQIHFMMTTDLGFKTDAIAYVHTPWTDQKFDSRELLKNNLEHIPEITQISLGGMPPASQNMATRQAVYKRGNEEITNEIQVLHGDRNYLNIYNIPLLAGRTVLNDTIEEYVINETAMRAFGFEKPEDAVNDYLEMNGKKKLIVGVMEDFNQRSLKTEIIPLVFTGDTSRKRRTNFRIAHFTLAESSTNWNETLNLLEKKFKEIYPEETFKVTFIDETIARFYEREQRIAVLLNWATGLSVLISCLGLLGLVIHTTERRTKEIGIRKVLGATVAQLNLLLCKDFLWLIGIAFLIAAPVAYWGLNNWLKDFAYKTDMSWWLFIGSGAAMILIALIIMSIRTISTAMKNPVNSLKTE